MAKIILTTGGTGGHVFPAISVSEKLRELDPDVQILFMGSEYGPEREMARKAELDFIGLPVRGFLGRGLKSIPAAVNLGRAFFKARSIIRKFNPDAMAAFGGYASVAPALAGIGAKVPLLVHEQNVIPGTANKLLSRFADVICASLENTAFFMKNVVVTGNPVRKQIMNVQKNRAFTTRNLLILGGSQGARGINKFIGKNLSKFDAAKINIWHQCGQKDYDELKMAYEQAGRKDWRITPFIDDMREAYEWADLAFCRSGASTLAELCVTGVPAVFVPFPAAIHDHQLINAQSVQSLGGAEVIQEKDLNDEATTALLIKLLEDAQKLKAMSANIKKAGRPDASLKIAEELRKIASIKKHL